MKGHIRTIGILLLVFINISCDQITKEVARNQLGEYKPVHLVQDYFILTKVENTGAALSLGQHLSPKLKVVFLQVFPIAMLIVLFSMILRQNKSTKWAITGYSFIIGGGIGNIADRIRFDSVTDFMLLQWGPLRTGIFNMADVSVVIGISLLLIDLIIQRHQDANKKIFS
ncbi:UNVERIFIED_CONTAM: hypothetical protein GTU68_011708 [Idotea baltica]|nr:hypothetical protein [Idotea baltica]